MGKPPAASDREFANLQAWKGMPLRWLQTGESEGGEHFFSGTYWSRATSEHWEIPLIAVAAYFTMIPLLRRLVARRGAFDVKGLAFWWNLLLSFFSWCGVVACVPVLAQSLWEHGLYFTTCAPASWYATGWSGLFVALFIYSKIAELVDTVLLLLAGKPVIALQWWHHSTVLLYCWHSYSVRIATGAWFACMNYSVHSIMYGYFAVVGTRYRKLVTPYAIYITLLQLVQMLVGMFASYFVLFFKLFIDNYYLKPKTLKKRASFREVARSVSRKMTQHVYETEPQEDSEVAQKKAN